MLIMVSGHRTGCTNAAARLRGRIRNILACMIIAFCSALAVQAQKLDVVIVDRQTNDTNYTYQIPGRLFAQSNANANCYGTANNVNCSGDSTTTGTVTSPQTVSYDVRGATFALRLPDGRLVIVNCESKYAPKGDHINRRSCRTPLIDEIRAEFDGDKAKLIWPVSIDGKKNQSETYKILAILAKP